MPAGIRLPTCCRTDFMPCRGLCHLYWSVLCNITLYDSSNDFAAMPGLIIFTPAVDTAFHLSGHRCTLYVDKMSPLQTSPKDYQTSSCREDLSHYLTVISVFMGQLVQLLMLQSHQSNHVLTDIPDEFGSTDCNNSRGLQDLMWGLTEMAAKLPLATILRSWQPILGL